MDETQQAAVAAIGSKAAYGGGGTAFISGLISNEVGVIVGIVVGVTGLLVNWYYKAKQDRRDQVEHDRRMSMHTQHDAESHPER
jgi:hypothetical protein